MNRIGIDVGGTTVKVGFFKEDGLLLDKWEVPTRKENNGEYILPDVAKSIEEKIPENKKDFVKVQFEFGQEWIHKSRVKKLIFIGENEKNEKKPAKKK